MPYMKMSPIRYAFHYLFNRYRCDSNYEGIACDRPIVSAALVVAISTLITMAILTSIITVVLWTRGVSLNPTKPPLDPVYGA